MPNRSTDQERKQTTQPTRAPAPASARVPEAPAHPAAAAARLGRADVLRLQRTIGNRAVQRLLAGRRASPAPPPAIQRTVLNWMPEKYEPPVVARYKKDENKEGLELVAQWTHKAAFVAKALDEATMEAHEHVQAVTNKVIAGDIKLTGIVAALDNMPHAQDYANKLGDAISGQQSMHPSAAGGYVIEDYVTAKHADDATFQFTPPELGGSRPDVIFTLNPFDEDGMAALYDITSEASAGHVLKKGGGSWVTHQKFPYVSELLYPPLKFDGTESRSLSGEELQLVKERAMGKQKEVEESAAKYRENWSHLYAQVTTEAAKRLTGKDRTWVKLGGRRGTSVLLDAGLLDTGGGVWGAVQFDRWWVLAENDANPRTALQTVAGWLKG